MFKYKAPPHLYKRGQAQGMARFTSDQMLEIYNNGLSHLSNILGKLFNIDTTNLRFKNS